MSDIFISYANEDRLRVKPLVDALAQLRWSVWWDRTILPGKRWEEVIDRALSEARCVIVVWSKASIQSEWVRVEANDARERGILVPVLLDDVKVPLAFRGIQTANLVHWRGGLSSPEFDELGRAIAETLGVAVRPGGTGKVVPADVNNSPRAEGAIAELGKQLHFAIHLLRQRRTIVLAGLLMLAVGLASLGWNQRARFADQASKYAALLSSSVKRGPEIQGAGGNYILIRAGTFLMGCSLGDTECGSDEKPTHKVTLTRDFYMGETDVTVGAYRRFAEATHRKAPDAPSFAQTDLHPVVNVSWQDAADYCKWDGGGRLPTEAEWEYAARAGTSQARYGTLDEIAWYEKNSGGGTHPVKQKQPNAFGVYDMLGNVWQWNADWHEAKYYDKSPPQDPPGPGSSLDGTCSVRGGSWFNLSRGVRGSYRYRYQPGDRYDGLGFRCVREVP